MKMSNVKKNNSSNHINLDYIHVIFHLFFWSLLEGITELQIPLFFSIGGSTNLNSLQTPSIKDLYCIEEMNSNLHHPYSNHWNTEVANSEEPPAFQKYGQK